MTCYRATEREWAGEGPCAPGEKCIWGCALHDLWAKGKPTPMTEEQLALELWWVMS